MGVADMVTDGHREFVEYFWPRVFRRAFEEIVTPNNDLQLPFVSHEMMPQLLGVRVDVVCQPLGKRQPNDVRRKAYGSMSGKGPMKSFDKWMHSDIGDQLPVVLGAGLDLPTQELGHRLVIRNHRQRFGRRGHIRNRKDPVVAPDVAGW